MFRAPNITTPGAVFTRLEAAKVIGATLSELDELVRQEWLHPISTSEPVLFAGEELRRLACGNKDGNKPTDAGRGLMPAEPAQAAPAAIGSSINPYLNRKRRLCSRPPKEIRAHWRERERQARQRDVDARIHRADTALVNVYLEAALLEIDVLPGWNPYDPNTRQKRGKIRGFSRRSRKRMLMLMAKIQRAAPLPLFLAVTYPAQWPSDPEVWKEHLNHLNVKLERAFPEYAAIWKLEPQKRGAPHFHLMVWWADFIPWQWLAVSWAKIIHDISLPKKFPDAPGPKGARAFRAWVAQLNVPEAVKDSLEAGVRVEKIETWRGAVFYVSKYMTKEVGGFKGVGRYWGILRRKRMPLDKPNQITVQARTGVWIKRIARRFLESQGIRLGGGRKLQLITNQLDQWLRVCELACELTVSYPSRRAVLIEQPF